MEIENFISEEFHKLKVQFESSGGVAYEGIYMVDKKDKFEKKEELELIKKAIQGKRSGGSCTKRSLIIAKVSINYSP